MTQEHHMNDSNATVAEPPTVPSRIAAYLPRSFVQRARPFWHWARELVLFFRRSGRVHYDWQLATWIARLPMSSGRSMSVAVRSYREFRRFLQFEAVTIPLVRHWVGHLTRDSVIYDVGAANGLEGFFIGHRHGSLVVFVEPFTPSVETILKTITYQKRQDPENTRFEVVHAACGNRPGYSRLYMHQGPVPGATRNSFDNPGIYCRGGRDDQPVYVSQWVKSVTLDEMWQTLGLPEPTHVKMDIDGFEALALEGAAELLKQRKVQSWCIEVNGADNVNAINTLMRSHGYQLMAKDEHYPGYHYYTGDHVYIREDLVGTWKPYKPEAGGV